MKIQVGNDTLNLSKNHFISQGGEGAVYVVKGKAYKVYHDRSNLIPIAKISELSKIQDDNVIKPLEVVYNRNKPVGYSMRYVANTHPLCKLFTRAFKQRNNLELSDIAKLVERMRDSVYSVHKEGILMVDCNELNFLVSEDFKQVYFIDTDSYQTPSFSATAIMDSIRDRHSKGFTKNSDWFSWGVVTFQMFMGIHPYKGKHPRLKTLESRMKNNISVFNAEVSIPKTVGAITSIPYTLRVWYENIFEKGLRCPPPGPEQSVVALDSLAHKPNFIEDMDHFNLTLIKTTKEPITKVEFAGIHPVVWTTKGVFKGNTKLQAPLNSYVYGDSYLVWLDQGILHMLDLQTNNVDPTNIKGTALMSREGRIYIHNGDKVLELIDASYKTKKVFMNHPIAQVLPNATHMFSGVILQNFLGSWYANIPTETKVCQQVPLHQLPKSCRVISAKSDGQVLAITYFHQGFYHRKVLIYDDFWRKADEWDELQVQNLESNFTVLSNDVCAYLTENEDLEIFKAEYGQSKDRRRLRDPAMNHGLTLCSVGRSVKFYQGNQLFTITVK